METFTALRPMVDNPSFRGDRQKLLAELDMGEIDEPLRDIVAACTKITCCFTLQCCWGHFVFGSRKDPRTLDPLPPFPDTAMVEYRIAYLALCVENNSAGRGLLRDLSSIPDLDPEYIQLGCARWFWERQVNSYALQVEPVRHQDLDSVMLSHEEALHIQKIRDVAFERLREILQKRAP
jgi:hypothetical protein